MAAAGSGAAEAAADVGFRDQAFPPDVSVFHKPSGQKPQSKLWFNDGLWWGMLFESASQSFHIFRLDPLTETWVDTGTAVDDRNSSSADVLWDGTHLYVASSSDASGSSDATRIEIFRLTYDPSGKRYVPDPAYTHPIAAGPVETVVLDKDSTGRLWLTYTLDNPGGGSRSVYVAHTAGPPADAWGAPFKLPSPVVDADNLSPDDISSVVAYAGRIGVMWSNQAAQAVYFATHVDGAPDTAWTQTTATRGPYAADDHINLKSVQGGDGRVLAAVKTSNSDKPQPVPTDDQVDLLDLNGGTWHSYVFGTVGDDHTRPIVLTDQLTRKLYVFATSPTVGGTATPQAIYYKETSLDNPSFAPGRGTPFIQSAGTDINDASSTKQDLATAPAPGLVVLASDASNYWHNVLDLGHPAPTPPPPTVTPTPPLQPPADRRAPRLTRLRLQPSAFSARRRPHRRAGTKVRFVLDERARVTLGAQRRTLGRAVGGACVRPTRSNRSRRTCTRYVVIRGALRRSGRVGTNRVAFSGRLGGHRLARGAYRLVAVATDAAGNASRPARARFRVLR